MGLLAYFLYDEDEVKASFQGKGHITWFRRVWDRWRNSFVARGTKDTLFQRRAKY